MGSGVPETILTEIIITVAECIRGYSESQADFQTLEAPLNPPRPAMVVLLMSMVNSKQPLSLRLGVLYCTACWLHKNPAAQEELIDTLLPSEGGAPSGGVTAGQLLCGALFSPDPTTSWLAACALSHAILNQRDNQDKLVRVQLAAAPNQPPISLSSQLDVMLSQVQFHSYNSIMAISGIVTPYSARNSPVFVVLGLGLYSCLPCASSRRETCRNTSTPN